MAEPTMPSWTPHPTLAGRDLKGHIRDWSALPEEHRTNIHRNAGRGKKARRYFRKCAWCGTVVPMLATQRYCSMSCKKKEHYYRIRGPRRAAQRQNSKIVPRKLTVQDESLLRVLKRPTDPNSPEPWYKQHVGRGVLVPLSDDLEDALTRLMKRRLYVLDRHVGGGIASGSLESYGAETPTTPHERLMHDLLLAGAKALLRSLRRGDKRKKSSKMTDLDSLFDDAA